MKSYVLASLVFASMSLMVRAQGPFQQLDYYSALRQARQQNRLVLLDFYTTWCGPCKLLDQHTWSDKSVQTWLGANTISLKIDADKEAKLAEKFNVHAYPAIVLVRPDGREAGRLVGYRDAKTFLKDVKGLLGIREEPAKTDTGGATTSQGSLNTDPAYWMKLARGSENKENRQAYALSLYTWCFDLGLKEHPEFIDIRQTELLADIVRFGRKYAPAIAALEERRDAAENTVHVQLALGAGKQKSQAKSKGRAGRRRASEGPASPWTALLKDGGDDPLFRAALDLGALNYALAESNRNIEILDELKKEHSVRATQARRAMFYFVFSPLLELRRYKDIVDCAGDPGDWLAYESDEAMQRMEEDRKLFARAAEAAAKKAAAAKAKETAAEAKVNKDDGAVGATKPDEHQQGDETRKKTNPDISDQEKLAGEGPGGKGDPGTGAEKPNGAAPDGDKQGAGKVPPKPAAASRVDHLARVISLGGGYYEAFLGAKQHRSAARIAKFLVELEPSARAYISLIRGATRAEAKRFVKKLVEEARSKLPAAEFEKVRLEAEKSVKLPVGEPKAAGSSRQTQRGKRAAKP